MVYGIFFEIYSGVLLLPDLIIPALSTESKFVHMFTFTVLMNGIGCGRFGFGRFGLWPF